LLISFKGGRFIETYYWDNYWILEGLLVSGMFDTAKTILENQIYLIENYGFIPNGSRVYYLNRSQPPYFSLMVMNFYENSIKSNELDREKKKIFKRFVLGMFTLLTGELTPLKLLRNESNHMWGFTTVASYKKKGRLPKFTIKKSNFF
jgi:neutral trehalase